MTTTALGRTSRAGVTLAGDEVRTYSALKLRAVTADGSQDVRDGPYTQLRGRAVPYEEWYDSGWFMEKMRAGVFRKSIREAAQTLPLLLWHDNRTFPVGVSRSWTESTTDGDAGLDGVWDLDPDDELAQTAADKINKQMMTGMSVGFAEVSRDGAMDLVDVRTDENVDIESWWDLPRDRQGMAWNEARLLEVSLTPTPAYSGAQVSLVRTSVVRNGRAGGLRRRSGEVDYWRRKLELLRREP